MTYSNVTSSILSSDLQAILWGCSVDQYQAQIAKVPYVKALKTELLSICQHSSITELQEFFKSRGQEFCEKMMDEDYRINTSYRGKSVFEHVLEELGDKLSDEIKAYLIECYSNISLEEQQRQANPLHVYMDMFSHLENPNRVLLEILVKKNPSWLRQGLKDESIYKSNVTPLILALKNFKLNYQFIEYLLELYQRYFFFTREEKKDLLASAQANTFAASPCEKLLTRYIKEMILKLKVDLSNQTFEKGLMIKI